MREPTYFVLASLLDGPLHGYAIIQRTEQLSGGRIKLATGTLYTALDRLTAEGHVELVREEIVNGRARRSYGLTPPGAGALRAEAERMAEAGRLVTEPWPRLEGGPPGPEGESCVSALERRCRRLLLGYPAWYRRGRDEEMLGTLLEASPPGRRWPSVRDTRALVLGGLRVRGWTWLASMLWVAAGAVLTGYTFYITTKPWDPDLGIPWWSTDPVVVQITLVLAIIAFLALPVPALIAGFIRLRGRRRGNWLRAAAWAGAWIACVALSELAGAWGEYPLHSCPNMPQTTIPPQCPYGSPAVVSWGELAICAAWLVLGAVMTWILARPARRSYVPDPTSRASHEASRWPPGAGDLQT
jgi:DNA-binding PadR family transcriptional regulator